VWVIPPLPRTGPPADPDGYEHIYIRVPLGAAVEAIQDSIRGPSPPAAPLLVLTGYAVLFGFPAMRFFGWE
jgi:hypothetical protein